MNVQGHPHPMSVKGVYLGGGYEACVRDACVRGFRVCEGCVSIKNLAEQDSLSQKALYQCNQLCKSTPGSAA